MDSGFDRYSFGVPTNYQSREKKGKKATLSPMVTGTSVIGITYDGGVMIAADTLGSYGSMAKFFKVSRVLKVNEMTVLGVGGDYADFQFMEALLKQHVIDEECHDNTFSYTPRSLHSWLTRVLYNRRSQINPLWNTYIVGGVQDGKPYLGYVDKLGIAYSDTSVASGYGSYIAQPLMRETLEKKGRALTREEARDLLERCMKVLYYRDCRALNRYEIAEVSVTQGCKVDGPFQAKTDWSIAYTVPKND